MLNIFNLENRDPVLGASINKKIKINIIPKAFLNMFKFGQLRSRLFLTAFDVGQYFDPMDEGGMRLLSALLTTNTSQTLLELNKKNYVKLKI